MTYFALVLIGILVAGSPTGAEEVSIMTTRGLSADRPFTVAYPEFLQQGTGPAGTAVFLQHPEMTFEVRLKIEPAPDGASAEAAAARLSADSIVSAERRTYPDFELQRHAVVPLPAGPAFVYTAALTSRAGDEARLRLVHAELYNEGRRYELRAYVAAELFDETREVVGFILANFSPHIDGRCCVGPVELP